MEILIAVLVAFGVVSGDSAKTMSKSELDKIVSEKGISQKEIDAKTKIIGLEEDSM
jgi:hypothetical protein